VVTLGDTTIALLVEPPGNHVYVEAPEAYKVVLDPAQILKLAVMVGLPPADTETHPPE
jgi:hypothetical protein